VAELFEFLFVVLHFNFYIFNAIPTLSGFRNFAFCTPTCVGAGFDFYIFKLTIGQFDFPISPSVHFTTSSAKTQPQMNADCHRFFRQGSTLLNTV